MSISPSPDTTWPNMLRETMQSVILPGFSPVYTILGFLLSLRPPKLTRHPVPPLTSSPLSKAQVDLGSPGERIVEIYDLSSVTEATP
jgi:hypothetical protein